MSRIEDHFKETLHRAVDAEPPVVDAWDRFERRARRDRRMRLGVALAGVAVIAAVSVFAVPRLLPNSTPVITPPDPSPTSDPYEGWESFTKTDHQYSVKVPPGWRVTSLEDVYEIIPDGLPGTAAGERTFAVSIAFFPGAPDFGSSPDEPRDQSRESSGTRPDGRLYTRWDLEGSDGSHSIRYDISWLPWTSCGPLGAPPSLCPKVPAILVVQIYAFDAELWDRYSATGEQIVTSIEHLTGPVPESPGPR